MKARVGDQLISEASGRPRAYMVIGLHNADGSPPYVVRWQADGHITLMFPGPFTKLVHGEGSMEHAG
jgi:hypothetical protein